MKALEKEMEIVNDLGLHARAATTLVKLTMQFDSEIELIVDGLRANAKSIMGLLALGARKGKKVRLIVQGSDQEEAFSSIKNLIESGFNEGASA